MVKKKFEIRNVENSDLDLTGGSRNVRTPEGHDDDVEMSIRDAKGINLCVTAGDNMMDVPRQLEDLGTLKQEILSQLSGIVAEEMRAALVELEGVLVARQVPDPSRADTVWKRVEAAWHWAATIIQVTPAALDAYERIRGYLQGFLPS